MDEADQLAKRLLSLMDNAPADTGTRIEQTIKDCEGHTFRRVIKPLEAGATACHLMAAQIMGNKREMKKAIANGEKILKQAQWHRYGRGGDVEPKFSEIRRKPRKKKML